MKSKLIIGIPLAFIAVMIARNYFAAPPVAFKNIRGYYMAEDGPHQGCLQLVQPGAGIKVMGFFSAAAAEAGTPDLTGAVKGDIFELQLEGLAAGGEAALTVGDGVLAGGWSSPSAQGQWRLTLAPESCF